MTDDHMPQLALAQVRAVVDFGARKHSPTGYVRDSRSSLHHMRKAMGHMARWEAGDSVDEETGCHPLAHTVARLLFVLERELRGLP